MKAQIPCQIWQEGDEYVAAQDDALVHAFGSTPQDAGFRLANALIEQHDRLHELGRDRLYPHLQRVLDYLDDVLDSKRYEGFDLVPQ